MDTTAKEEVRRARRLQAGQGIGGPSIGRLLAGGFLLIFALWLVSGLDLVRRLDQVEDRQAALSTSFRRAERSLTAIQAQVLLGSVYLRDALLDIDRDPSDDYHQRLEQSRAEIEQALAQYQPVVQSETERSSFRMLQAEIDDYWNSLLEPVLSWDATRKAFEARALLRRQVIPKRELISRISTRIQRLNREAYDQQQAEVSQIFRQLQTRVWTTSGFTLLLSLVVAGAVTRYAMILEDRIRQELVRDVEHARDLQRLSAKLVDVQEQERRSIARELHDEVGQALTAIKVELAVAERNAGLPEKAHLALGEVRAITDRTLQQVRDLSQLLHPSLLDDLGLPAALEWYLKGFSRRTDVKAELLQDRMEARLPPAVETCVFRVVQEALTNVARHARASSARVYLQRLPHTVLLTVEDDGLGLTEAPGGEPRGLGLLGIRERATELGGTFRVESQPGKGTRLTVELPVEIPQGELADAAAHPAG
ncbi:MAG: histidine kinase [Acidobacteria bacterium]|nr:histidine kinase [Acidobacteriota bacterium]